MIKENAKKLLNYVKDIRNVQLDIKTRLILGFSVNALVVIFILLAMYSILNLNKDITRKNIGIITPSLTFINNLTEAINNSNLLVKNWIYIERQSDTPDKKKLVELHNSVYPQLYSKIDSLSEFWDDDLKVSFDSLHVLINDSLFVEHQEIMSSLSDFDSYDDPMVIFEVMTYVSDGGIVEEHTQKALAGLNKIAAALKEQNMESSKTILNSFVWYNVFMVFAFIVIIAISVITSVFTIKLISSPIYRLRDSLQQKSQGLFLKEEFEQRKDEIGEMMQALNEMSDNVRRIVNEIQLEAQTLEQNSSQIATSAREIADGASKQAASSEEVSTSLEQMTSTIDNNTENANTTEKIAIKVNQGINHVNSAVIRTSDAMQNIVERISVINEIAEKIDLLAINAAIEAARAGENGKGFSVVAQEIRKLAVRTQNAANVIDEASKSSVEIALESKNRIQEIIPEVEKTKLLVQNIAAASNEQSTGIAHVNTAILDLSNVTQHNSSASEQLSAGAEGLLNQSQKLLDTIGFFKLTQKQKQRSREEIETEIARVKAVLEQLKEEEDEEDNFSL